MQGKNILITGMHRSGTSMMANILMNAGVYFGEEDDLYGSNTYDNPEGYREFKSFVKFNNRLLEDLGGSWHNPPEILSKSNWMSDIDAEKYQNELLKIFAPLKDKPYWGVKDPRATLTSPLFLSVFPDSKIILCLRHPLEVAISLTKRLEYFGGFEQSLQLWLEYHQVILNSLRLKDLIVTHYKAYFFKPELEIQRICDLLDIKTTRDETHKLGGLIDQNLYRGVVPPQLELESEVYLEAMDIYETLCKQTGEVYSQLTKDKKYQQLHNKNMPIKLFNLVKDISDQGSTIVQKSNQQIADQRIQLEERRNEIKAQRNQVKEQRNEIKEQKNQLEEQRNKINQQRNQVEEQRNKIKEQRSQAEVMRNHLGILRSQLQFKKGHVFFDALSSTFYRFFYPILGKIPFPLSAKYYLFDKEWYQDQYSQDIGDLKNPLKHYLQEGWKRGFLPNPLFDPNYYLDNNRDIADLGIEPLSHFQIHGWKENRKPSKFFDPYWYLEIYKDVKREGKNPLHQFLTSGCFQGRRPSQYFDLDELLNNHSVSENNLKHPVIQTLQENNVINTFQFQGKDRFKYLSSEISNAFKKKEDFSTYEPKKPVSQIKSPLKVMAFYLPQFHPVPENDEWWGKNFTEWTNVSKARPLFEGHYQPRLPGDLGFYDLRIEENLKDQAELAKAYGIHGFCFHHYWFNGRRILEKPVDTLINNPEIDINFSLCWANENWTRRWDGRDQDVLLEQIHTPEDDIAFIESMEKYFSDPRYIKVDNKPLLIIYNPNKLPDPNETRLRWERFCQSIGFDGIFLVSALTFKFDDPNAFNFDAAVEFPPHKGGYKKTLANLEFFLEHEGRIWDYETLRSAYKTQKEDFVLFKTVSPSWDNTARKGAKGTVFHNSTPLKFEYWLRDAFEYSQSNLDPNHQFVFINAWNEWAEAAYLEPDRHYGYAYLNALQRALVDYSIQED
jgi:hypothetical protein